jgi:hypothetical protein
MVVIIASRGPLYDLQELSPQCNMQDEREWSFEKQ